MTATTDERVKQLTADIQKTHERLSELLCFVYDESHNMSTVEGATDSQQEYASDVRAVLAVQQYAVSFKPEYVEALEQQLVDLRDGISFNISQIIRLDDDLYREAVERGLTDELVLPDGTVFEGRLQYDDNGNPIVDMVECHACEFRWNDALITSVTPAPSGRCPNEYDHEPEEEYPA